MISVRLNKLLSQSGVASRRAADELIRQGRVTLNGHVVAELGTKADPDRDDIKVDGRRLKAAPVRRYLLLNKPRNIVSTRSDPQGRPTVVDLVARAGIGGYFYPVGRLDFDSEGLLILTNDGEFAERVTHPRYQLDRTYEALVEGTPDERDLERLRRGIVIDGRRTLPAKVRRLRAVQSRAGERTLLEIIIREGRHRQVRRMCDAIAHPVGRLRRTRIGTITSRGLGPGELRELTAAELRALTGSGTPRTRPR
ncbi:MAG TPA: pseudouridine synthase [Vicinamibacterales bacterium]|nr:pseudouridine synthase [Vicinamibacterales bacterium]